MTQRFYFLIGVELQAENIIDAKKKAARVWREVLDHHPEAERVWVQSTKPAGQ